MRTNRSRLTAAAFAFMMPMLAHGAESAPAPAAAAAPKADAAKIAGEVCAACHGADGNSAAPVNPNLAGQHADYITLQLKHFKAGTRQNPTMQAMAATLTPEAMSALGVYFAGQKPKGLAAKDAELAKAGQRLYRGGDIAAGIPACASCHSPTGAGVPRNFPRVSGQYADYAYAQLKAFASGGRGADPEGKDVNGRIMSAIAQKMSDAQMKAAAEYMSGLR
jgi:cytochrome c553